MDQSESVTSIRNLDEAVALYREETGWEPTDEEVRELGIDDPADDETGDEEPSSVLD